MHERTTALYLPLYGFAQIYESKTLKVMYFMILQTYLVKLHICGDAKKMFIVITKIMLLLPTLYQTALNIPFLKGLNNCAKVANTVLFYELD